MKKVTILQHRLLHYRKGLFEQLRMVCAERGIELNLVYGQASLQERTKQDEGSLSWAYKVRNRFWRIGGRDLLWQPFPAMLRDTDLIIIMQESRILSNYFFLVSKIWSKRKIAYWGHGKNFQSDAPYGLRERWKNSLLKQVDWWFAYTSLTVDILLNAGYQKDKITCLNNSIDTSGFKEDLASWSCEEISSARKALGIDENAVVALFCGSLYPDKRLDLLIDAADLIRKKISNFTVLVVGDGPSKCDLEEAATSRPWIHLLGVKKGKEKALYFRMANIMLNPGLVGLHIVDAFCSGLVMITTTTARHSPEVAYLHNGINGVATSDSPEAYSAAVVDVVLNSDRLGSMRHAALMDAERYTLRDMVRRFADGIEAAIHD